MANGITNISGGKALSGTAQPSDVRLGMTYADGKELREGTLDLRNLKAENIKKDVNIAGVVGMVVPLGFTQIKKKKIQIPNWYGDYYTLDITIPKHTFAVSVRGYINTYGYSDGYLRFIFNIESNRIDHKITLPQDYDNEKFFVIGGGSSTNEEFIKKWNEGAPMRVMILASSRSTPSFQEFTAYYFE